MVWATRTRRIWRGVPPSVSGVNNNGSVWNAFEKRRQHLARRRRFAGEQRLLQADGERLPRRRPSARRIPDRIAARRALQGADGQRRVQAGADDREQQLLLEDAAAVVLDQRIVIAGRLAERMRVDGVEQGQQPLLIVARRAQPGARRLLPSLVRPVRSSVTVRAAICHSRASVERKCSRFSSRSPSCSRSNSSTGPPSETAPSSSSRACPGR